jgi:hypothetical protein
MGTRLYINTEDYMVNERIMGAPSGTIEKIEEMNEVGTEGFYDWIYEKENEQYLRMNSFMLYGFGKFDLDLVEGEYCGEEKDF